MAVFAALFATGNLFGTPVSGSDADPECELIVEGGTATRYATIDRALNATKSGENIEKNVTVKLLRDCKVSKTVELPKIFTWKFTEQTSNGK